MAQVWTMSGGIRIDNVVVGRDEAAAAAFGTATWAPKHKAEMAAKRAISNEERRVSDEIDQTAEGLLGSACHTLSTYMRAAPTRSAR